MSIASSLARRRSQERTVKEREIFLKDELNATSIAKWEERSVHQIRKHDLAMRVRRLRDKNVEDLQERKLKLQSLYEAERYEWEEELRRMKEIPLEQKINAIRDRAHELQQKRRVENEEFVAKCFQRQREEGCDDTRSLNAKALVGKLVCDRKHSTSMKATDNKEYNGISTQLMQEKKDKEDALERQRRNLEMKLALDEQVQFNQRRRAQEIGQRQREEALQLDSLKQEEEREKIKKNEKIRLAQESGRQMKERLDNREREEENRQKQREECVLLDYALEKERKEINSEVTKKDYNQGAAQAYVTLLNDQMVKDAKDTCKIDIIREAAMQEIWQKKDQEQKLREDNRQRLAMEVKASREEQIREKKEREFLMKVIV